MISFHTYDELQYQLADKIKAERKRQGFSQKEMQDRTGIPLSTYARIEQEGEGSIRNLMRVLISLKREDEIERMLKSSKESPVERYEKAGGGRHG